MKNFLSLLAVSCLVLTACKSSGPGLPDTKSLETASSSQAPAVCPNEQPNTLGATRICLDAALNEGKFDYFHSQFAKAWQQGLLRPEDGHVFLLAALQQNQLELMRFLFDKGAPLQASEFPIVRPGQIPDLPQNFQQSGIVLKGKANQDLLTLLLNGARKPYSEIIWKQDHITKKRKRSIASKHLVSLFIRENHLNRNLSSHY